jgi:PleD family two-component response regulator
MRQCPGFLLEEAREDDIAACYGDEEFLIVKRGQDGWTSHIIGERLVEGFRKTRPRPVTAE